MLEYIDDLGQTYTENDINRMAAEQKTSADAIIKNKKLKQKTAKSTVAAKPKAKKYPWSDGQEKKEEVGFLGNFKKSKKEQPLVTAATKSTAGKQEKDGYGKALQESMDYFTETRTREAIGLDAAPLPGSFGRKKFEQEQEALTKKTQRKKEIEEEEKTIFSAKVADLDLKYNDNASQGYKSALEASQLDEEDINYLDEYVKNELARDKKFVENSAMYSRIGEADPDPYVAFEKQRKTVIQRLKKNGTLDEYNENQILQEAALEWKKQEEAKIREDKFTRHLADNSNITEKSREIIKNYTIAKGENAALTYINSSTARNELVKEQSDIENKIIKIDSNLKPKNYKFTTQEEVDAENALIKEREELVGYYNKNNDLAKTLENKISSSSNEVKDLNFAYDMFKRDYSTSGSLKRRGTKVLKWLNEGGGLAGYGFDFLVNSAIQATKIGPTGTYRSTLSDKAADNALALDEYINNTFEKDLNNLESAGEWVKHTGDLVLDFAPDLAVMVLTMGESAVIKEASKQAAKKSLLARGASALSVGKETLPIGARVASSKYLDMVNEQKHGYYNESGTKIMPNYNTAQLMLVPAAYGYMESVGEKATAGIIKRNSGFFKILKETNQKAYSEFGNSFFKKFEDVGLKGYLKDAGKSIIKGQLEEQPAEFLTYVGQDLADKFLLGKEVNLLENTGEVFKDTGLLTIALTGAPMVGGLLIKPFMSQATSDKIVLSSIKLIDIEKKLKQEDLTDIQKVKLQKEKEQINSDMQGIIGNTVDNINDMPSSVYNSVSASATKVAAIVNKAKEISESDIDQEKKDADIATLRNEYLQEKLVLNSLTRSIEGLNTFGKPINSITRGELIGLQAERVAISFNNNLSKEQRDDANAKIEKRIEAIYAANDVNINEERTKEYEQNLKVAQKLATSSNVLIIEGNNQDDLLAKAQLRFKNKEISEADLDDLNAMIEGEAEGGFSDSGNVLFIQKDLAVERKAVTVGSHEFLHKLLQKTMQNATTQINLGRALGDYLIKTNPELYLNDKVVGRQYGNYNPEEAGNFNEELLTIFSDALLKGEVKYNESFFTKLGDIIRRFFQDLGVSNIEFNSGVDVYNFIKDYNNTISKGKDLKGAIKRVLEGGAEGSLIDKDGAAATGLKKSKSIEERMDELDRQLNDNEIDMDRYDAQMLALEQEEAELARKEYEEKRNEVKPTEKKPAEKKPTKAKEDVEVSDVANKAKAKLDAIGNDPKGFNPNNPEIYSELDKMVKVKSRNYKTAKGTVIDLTNKDRGGIDGFNMEEMVSYVRTSMIPYIAKFDPARNNSLYGYINAQYINRMKGALKSGEVADVVFTEDVSEMTKLANEDVEVTKPSLPERKRFQNILESGVFSPDVIANIQTKILPVVRTLKSKINEKTSLNKTVAPLISEIKDEMGKQADIDIKKAMGGKENQELQNWLITNKKTILENMTTTWLMGKDGVGGMPFAIQKRINGRWVNFPEWKGQKIDRESVSTDLAGRTSGAELARRLPEVNKNVSTVEFLSSIIDLETGNPIRGRKESLAKALAEEVSFDIISDDIANDGVISEALNKNQELKGAVVEKIMVEEFNRLTERGNVKFSLSKRNIDVDAAIKYIVSTKGDIDIINLTLKEPSKDYNTTEFRKLHKYLVSNGVTEDDINVIINKYTEALNKVGYGYHEKFIESIINSTSKTGIVAKNYGGNNNVLPDLVIGKNSNINTVQALRKNKGNIAIVEVKLSPFARITSSTLSSLIDKYSNEDWFDNVNTIYDNFKKSNLYSKLSEYFERDANGKINITKARAIRIKPDSIQLVKDLLVGNVSIGDKDLPLSSVTSINNNKSYPNDLLVLGTYATDYFGPEFLSSYNIDLGENNNMDPNIINSRIELKIDNGGFLRARVYFSIKRDVANQIYKVNKESNNLNTLKDKAQLVIDNKILTRYSKSLENNLNSFNKDNNGITIVSDYIAKNDIKRIDAETSFEVLNDLNKSIEDWWGIVSNNTIENMNRSVDYAFDVIEDRENEGGSLMAAVNDALNIETIKFAEKQLNDWINSDPKWSARPKFSKSLDYEFNDMLERNKNVPSYEKISDIVAKRAGTKANTLSFFVPPSADDFRGLTTYMFAGKGKQGELDQEFFDANLVIPYVKGINALDSVRQSIKKEYKKLLDSFPDIKKKLEKLTPDKQFTYDQAVRVYLWHKNDIDVPGLNRRDKNKLVFLVKNDPNLISFAEALSIAGRQDGGWMPPSTTWDSETIISDLHNITEGEGRKKWLSEFIENANAIFTTENLNKVQATYGTDVRIALEDSLYRMKNGKNRPEGSDRLTNAWMNWINGSTAAIMFFNVRSALLQTISSTNYLNWNDNNPLAAATAFANQKQYWSDFAKIINSDKMRERRSGLKADVTQAEIANAANSATNKARGVLSYLQKIGFTPTQAADSFSIALGGSSFYRNRVNTYLKQVDEDGNKINTLEEAEDKAWVDFSLITDKSMQSADPMYISKQQTTSLGRLVLAFANTPMQYNREIKKATLDLVNKRGDWKTNLSKIMYYGALQNILFSALQSALFLPFEEEDEEAIAKMSSEQKKEYEKLKKKQDDKAVSILNGMSDTVLRGSGVYGALISTIKNAAMEYNKQEEREMFADHAYTILAAASISPPISSKAKKLYGAYRIKKFDKDVIEARGWEITKDGRLNLSPNYDIVGNVVVATTNLPLDRVVEKVGNVSEALDSRNTKIQRLALALGWKEWELNVKNEENEKIKVEAKAKRKEEGIEKGIISREEKRKADKKALMEMDPKERLEFRRKKALEKRERLLKKRKRKMGGD